MDHPFKSANMKTPITVSIVEDLEDIRSGMVELLQNSSDFLCVSSYGNAENAIQELPDIRPDIVLMDIGLPGESGIEAVRHLAGICRETRFLMFTIYENNQQVFEALKAGASGYILKNTSPEKILENLRELYEGGSPMSAQIARKVVLSFQKASATGAETVKLTAKEKEVLDLLARGFLYKEIAGQLQINTTAVRQRVHKIYGKLHVQNRTEALNKIFNKPYSGG